MRRLSTYLKSNKTKSGSAYTEILVNPADDLVEVYSNIEGETEDNQFLIIVNGGVHNIQESIVVRNFIHWKFLHKPTIKNTDNTKAPDGLFTDNNIETNIDFNGAVILQNSNGSAINRGINLQHADSHLKGFAFKFKAHLTMNASSLTVGKVIENTVGEIVSAGYDAGPGYFVINFMTFRGGADNGLFTASIQPASDQYRASTAELTDGVEKIYLKPAAGSQNFYWYVRKSIDDSNYTLQGEVKITAEFSIEY